MNNFLFLNQSSGFNNNKMERLNGEIRDHYKVMRGLKISNTPILTGYQLFHNYIRPHMGLEGKTPSEACGIQINGDNKWITLIQNASYPTFKNFNRYFFKLGKSIDRVLTKSNATEANKALALEGIRGLFIDRDPAVVDRLFAADYRQHNPQIPNGPAAIKAVVGKLPADFKYELGLVIADGDYVSIHGRYTGWGPKPMVAVDIFRVANGKIAEHWDVMQEEVPAGQSANGNSMVIGPVKE